VPWAWVVLASGTEVLDADALAQRCRDKLAPYAVPARFLVVQDLPRNDVGKVLRRELVEQAAAMQEELA
jgi:long-chain acyl-CoA synthetase